MFLNNRNLQSSFLCRVAHFLFSRKFAYLILLFLFCEGLGLMRVLTFSLSLIPFPVTHQALFPFLSPSLLAGIDSLISINIIIAESILLSEVLTSSLEPTEC